MKFIQLEEEGAATTPLESYSNHQPKCNTKESRKTKTAKNALFCILLLFTGYSLYQTLRPGTTISARNHQRATTRLQSYSNKNTISHRSPHSEGASNIRTATKEDTYEALFKELGSPILLYFCDPTSTFCPKFNTEMENMAKELKTIHFVKVDRTVNTKIAEELSIAQSGSFYFKVAEAKEKKDEGYQSFSTNSQVVQMQGIHNVDGYAGIFGYLKGRLRQALGE